MNAIHVNEGWNEWDGCRRGVSLVRRSHLLTVASRDNVLRMKLTLLFSFQSSDIRNFHMTQVVFFFLRICAWWQTQQLCMILILHWSLLPNSENCPRTCTSSLVNYASGELEVGARFGGWKYARDRYRERKRERDIVYFLYVSMRVLCCVCVCVRARVRVRAFGNIYHIIL